MKKVDLPLQSDAEVAALYRALRHVCDAQRLTMEQIFDGAFTPHLARGTGYLDNFRKGKIARARAAKLYQWLRSKHPAFADDLDAELVRMNTPKAPHQWESFISEHGVFEKVSVGPPHYGQQEQYQLEQLTRDEWERELRYQETMPLNVPFKFFLRERYTGYIVALQWMRGRWFALPLVDAVPGIALDGKIGKIPPDSDSGLPLEDRSFHEPNETGLHRFVFLLMEPAIGQEIANGLCDDEAIEPERLDALAARLAAIREHSPWELFRLHVMFVVTDQHVRLTDTWRFA